MTCDAVEPFGVGRTNAETIRKTNATRSKPERIFRLIGLGRGRFITGELGGRGGPSGKHLTLGIFGFFATAVTAAHASSATNSAPARQSGPAPQLRHA